MSLETILQQENLELKMRIEEAEGALEAIRRGEVDAIVVKGEKGDQLYSLISPEHPYKFFIENMLEAALIVSNQGTILYANQSFFDMVNLPPQKIIGASIVDYIEKAQQSYFMEVLKKEGRKRSEFTMITSEDQKISVQLSVSKGTWENSENLCLLISNVSDLKKAERLIQASEHIAKSLSGTPPMLSALQGVINELNSCLGWEVITLWSWSEEQTDLECLEVAYVVDINAEEFARKTKHMKATKGSIPDQVWTSYHPLSIEDIALDFTILRRTEAIEAGLHGVLSFPIYENRQLTGILELFRRHPFQEKIDNTLYTLLSSIGIDVGLYLQRKAVEETNSQFIQLIEHSSNGIYRLDNQGIVKSWNPGAEIIYGWAPEEIIGTHINKIYPIGQKNEYVEIQKNLLTKKTIELLQSQQIHKNGTLLSVNNTYGGIRDALGVLIEICVIAEDVSSNKKGIETLKQIEERFETFIAITEDWIWELDKAGNFTFSSPAVERILGYMTEEVTGKNILYFLSPENTEIIQKQFEENIIQKEGWRHKVMHFIHKNGDGRFIESNARQMLNSNHELIGYRGASHDITLARSVEKIKNEFISMVSHELRTPMTSIHGALTLLQSPKSTSQEKEELLKVAKRNSERLINLVNDIIDVQKLELGHLKYVFKRTNLCGVISEAINSSAIIAKRFDVKIVTKGLLPDAEVFGDSQRLTQVILNLLSNAIKFTPAHGIVEVALENLENTAKVSIKDQGPGIPKEFEPKLFEKFMQADSSSTRGYGGTGLGLSISQSIINAHKGKILYTTEIGKGTVFFFELPKYKQES